MEQLARPLRPAGGRANQKLELKVFEQRDCLGSHRIQEVVYRSYVLQGVGTTEHSSKPYGLPWEAFYDTLLLLVREFLEEC